MTNKTIHPVLRRYEAECDRLRVWSGGPPGQARPMHYSVGRMPEAPEFDFNLATLMDDMALAIRQLSAQHEAANVVDTSCTLGVGDGSGQLFVHGSYEAIKACQALIGWREHIEPAHVTLTVRSGSSIATFGDWFVVMHPDAHAYPVDRYTGRRGELKP